MLGIMVRSDTQPCRCTTRYLVRGTLAVCQSISKEDGVPTATRASKHKQFEVWHAGRSDLQRGRSPHQRHPAGRNGYSVSLCQQTALCPASGRHCLCMEHEISLHSRIACFGMHTCAFNNAQLAAERRRVGDTWGTTATAPLSEPCCSSRTSIPSNRTAPPCSTAPTSLPAMQKSRQDKLLTSS